MANRGKSNSRQRARKQTPRRAQSEMPRSRRAGARGAADAARAAQAQLLQGVQQVWLAGMGAIARAQKDGPGAFSDAVVEGLRLLNQSRSTAQQVVRDAFESAQETLQSRVGGARSQAQDTWDSLESLFQSRVQRAMHQLGVPTAEEIRVLTRRVAELNESVARLGTRERTRGPAATQRRTPRSTRPRKRRAAPTSTGE